MLRMLNRLCWNSKGWQAPTHTSVDGGYPKDEGFGHEEWNFNISDTVDHFVYGYVYFRPPDYRVREANGKFQIFFWTMHPETRSKLLVGWYDEAELVNDDAYENLYQEFQAREIFVRRKLELLHAVPYIGAERAEREVYDSVEKHYLNFRCHTDKVVHLEKYVPLDDLIPHLNPSLHFASPKYLSEDDASSLLRTIAPDNVPDTPELEPSALAEDAYWRESPATLERILRRHNELSNRYAEWLKRNGYTNVKQEKNYVDVIFSKRGTSYLTELKICSGVGTTKAIREALGQLLEYNYYPNRLKVERWAIVLDTKPSDLDIAYIKRLRQELKQVISLGWWGPLGFVFADGLDL